MGGLLTIISVHMLLATGGVGSWMHSVERLELMSVSHPSPLPTPHHHLSGSHPSPPKHYILRPPRLRLVGGSATKPHPLHHHGHEQKLKLKLTQSPIHYRTSPIFNIVFTCSLVANVVLLFLLFYLVYRNQ